MADNLTQKEIESIEALDEDNRYQYFLKQIIQSDHVYLPKDNKGWIDFNFKDGYAIQVWSAPEFGLRLFESINWLPLPSIVPMTLEDFLNGFFLEDQKDFVSIMPVITSELSIIKPAKDVINDIKSYLKNTLSMQPGYDPNNLDILRSLRPAIKQSMKSKPKGSLPK